MIASLRSRLVLSNLLITLLGLLVIVGLLIILVPNWLKQVREQERRSQAKSIAAQVERIYRKGGKGNELGSLVTISSRVLGARVVIVNPSGIPVQGLDSAGQTPYFTNTYELPSAAALKAGRAFQRALKNPSIVAFQQPIRPVHRTEDGAVVLIVNVGAVQPSQATIAELVAATAGTALIVWLLIGMYFTFSISRPLLSITEATARMARGDYSVRVHLSGEGEISRLAARFNAMAEQVQRSNQVLRDFVANVSHDLRTPLTMISGFSQALLDGTAGPEDIEEAAEVIHEESTKMQRLVEDLLQLTRLESGLLTLDRGPVALQPFVHRLLERVTRARSGEPLPELRNLVSSDLPAADADAIQLERALRNLLDNAIRFTPPTGVVSVLATRRADGMIEIAVQDTGSGIPEGDVERVFERFYRSDKSRDRGEGHSGLGLAIVREIVEAHGGTVDVRSGRGQGTTFLLTVPETRGRAMPRGIEEGVAV